MEKLAITQKSLISEENQAEIKIDFGATKDEIITEIKGDIRILGISSDSHFEANRKNIEMLDENIRKVLNIAARIRKQQRETAESQKTDNAYFNFRFFKFRKSSLAIAILGLLVFTLTLFCMKQQSDYALLMDEFHKQSFAIREMQAVVDSLRSANAQKVEKKKK